VLVHRLSDEGEYGSSIEMGRADRITSMALPSLTADVADFVPPRP
jgi:ApbE superfamily uncharacterized protein (UPF0280 family)